MRKCFVIWIIFVFSLSFSVPAFADPSANAGAEANANSASTSIGGIGIGGDAIAVTGPSSASIKDLSSSATITDNSVTNIKNINRQFPYPVQPQPPQQMQYFGPWQMPKIPWNMFFIEPKEWTYQQIAKLKKGAKIDKKNIKILVSFPFQEKIFIAATEPNNGATLVGYGVVRGKIDSISYEVLAVLLDEAMKNGANVLVIKAFGWQQKAKSSGWHLGFGGGASGIVDGNEERLALQGAGGTGIGSSSVSAEGMPWIQAVFYKDGKIVPTKEIKPAETEIKQQPLEVEQISPSY